MTRTKEAPVVPARTIRGENTIPWSGSGVDADCRTTETDLREALAGVIVVVDWDDWEAADALIGHVVDSWLVAY